MFDLKLFKKRPSPKDEAEKRHSRAERGAKLRQLKESNGWSEVERLRDAAQQNAGEVALGIASTDRERLQASVQFATIENFFNEIDRRITEGEKAQKEIEELAKRK